MRLRNLGPLTCLVIALCSGATAQSTYLYVGNYGDNSVSGYAVNRSTGGLNAIANSPVAAGSNPGYVAIDPQCRFAYVSNISSQNVSAYSIDTNDGNLTPILGSPFVTSDAVPGYMWIDRMGKFLLIPMQGFGGNGSSVSVYAIDGDTGVITQVAGSPVNTGGIQPDSVTVDPTDRFVYIANTGTNTVSGFTLDPDTGTLTPIPGSPWPTSGNRPIVVRTDNTGRFVYVTNRSSISIFTIDQITGALSPISGSPVAVGFDLYHMAFDTTNKYMYVADNFDAVYGYSIDSTTGGLTALPGFPIRTDNPQGNAVFAVDPGGSLLYTSSFGGSNTVSAWKIDPDTGALTQLGRVPTGSFPGSIAVCTADAEGAMARVVGNNTYDGNQTVLGNVTANSFFGSGAGLTGVNAANLNGISGTSYARLDIDNSFAGNQSFNGAVAASAFSGNGAGLTNLSPASINAGTAGINITGTAQAAINAGNLGGIAPSSYARLDIRNSFAVPQHFTDVTVDSALFSNLTVSGPTTLGGGTVIIGHYSSLYTPSFPLLKPSTCASLNFSFPNTVDGDTVALGVPNSRMTGGGTLLYTAWISAANTVTIRVCNIDPGVKQTVATSGSIRVDVWRH